MKFNARCGVCGEPIFVQPGAMYYCPRCGWLYKHITPPKYEDEHDAGNHNPNFDRTAVEEGLFIVMCKNTKACKSCLYRRKCPQLKKAVHKLLIDIDYDIISCLSRRVEKYVNFTHGKGKCRRCKYKIICGELLNILSR